MTSHRLIKREKAAKYRTRAMMIAGERRSGDVDEEHHHVPRQ
jgi:hypothetical protein